MRLPDDIDKRIERFVNEIKPLYMIKGRKEELIIEQGNSKLILPILFTEDGIVVNTKLVPYKHLSTKLISTMKQEWSQESIYKTEK